jgi:hypothetical protein
MSSRGSWVAWCLFAVLILALPGQVLAVAPPSQINYQGVLRGPSDDPLTGTYEMVFRFFDADTGGDEILVDRHQAATGKEVTVDGGLFSVALGFGLGVTDGSGPGTYTSLTAVFRDFPAVWLEVTIGSETLSPRTRILAAGYALSAANAVSADTATTAATASTASNLNGQPASFYLDTSSTRQFKSGAVQFQTSDASGHVVEAVAQPGSPGALMAQGTSAYCELGEATVGAACGGSTYGGYFTDTTDNSYAYLGDATYGVYTAGSSYGVAASGGTTGTGLYGEGVPAARFVQSNSTDTNVNIAYSGYGVFSRSHNGIYNLDVDNNSYAYLGQGAYKVLGTGAVSFVQNDPDHSDRVVVYHAPESSEVNVYTRGSAKLENGVAHIALDPTFVLTANPDLGLTAHLTPRVEPVPLAVEAVSATDLVVRGPEGSNVAFDYQVMGLRIGFEEMPAVAPKDLDSVIPRTATGEDVYAAHPELRSFNALERYKTIAHEVGRDVDPELKASARLRNRIRVGRPMLATDDAGAPGPFFDGPAGTGPRAGAGVPGAAAPAVAGVAGPAAATAPALVRAADGPAATTDRSAAERPGNAVDAGDGRRAVSEGFPAVSSIDAGDVVVLDPESPGSVRRSGHEADRTVVGIALAPARGGWVDVAVGAVAAVRADASYGAIHAGDLLVTSPASGAAMRGDAVEPGTILGKALEPLDSGVGTIRVLVMFR